MRRPWSFPRVAGYVFGVFLPPLFVGILVALSAVTEVMIHKNPEKPESHQTESPALDAAKPTALFVLSNSGAEVTDLFAPYEILAESGAFNVVTTAPARIPTPTTGHVTVLPDFEFAKAPKADVLLIPSSLDPSNATVLEFVRARAENAKLVVSLGEGALTLAHAGLLRGRTAVSHFVALPALREIEPQATFIEGPRYALDGRFLTSAGVTGSIDAGFFVIEKLMGRKLADETSEQLGTKWNRESDPAMPSSSVIAEQPLGAQALLRLLFDAGYDWYRKRTAVLLYPGVSELALAAALDTFPRTFSSPAFTIAPRRIPITTKHGLNLVSEFDPSDSPYATLMIVPSSEPDLSTTVAATTEKLPSDEPAIHRWVVENSVPVKSFFYESSGNAFDRMLGLIAETHGAYVSSIVARLIEAPGARTVVERADANRWPLMIWLRPLVLSLAGLLLTWLVDRRFNPRAQQPRATPDVPQQPAPSKPEKPKRQRRSRAKTKPDSAAVTDAPDEQNV